MKVLIIGFGSVGRKHVDTLLKIDSTIEIIALRKISRFPNIDYPIRAITSWNKIPSDIDFFIISNPTSLHEDSLVKVLKWNKPIFLEKPPLHRLDLREEISSLIKKNKIPVYCAFNMKFHPLLNWVKNNIINHQVLEANCYCGSYLPDWRPTEDYTKSYSSRQTLGGGVHLDLIHEVDYITWLFGKPIKTIGIARKNSTLDIDSFDNATYLLLYKHTTVTINLNYFRKIPKRAIEFVTENGVIYLDFLKGSILNEDNTVLFNTNTSMADTYIDQMRYFLHCITNNLDFEFNNFDQGMNSLEISLNINKD